MWIKWWELLLAGPEYRPGNNVVVAKNPIGFLVVENSNHPGKGWLEVTEVKEVQWASDSRLRATVIRLAS